MEPTQLEQLAPSFAQIEPVGQCNLRCEMCAIQFRQDGPPFGPPAFMAFDAFQRIIDELPRLRELHLQGLGEPLMHPRFFDMVKYAVERGARVTTNSNLTLLNPRKARELVASGLETLHVSIDGATAETYGRIRVRSHLERVIANLRLVRAAKTAAGASNPRLKMVVVVMRQNLHELSDLVRLSSDEGFEAMSVQHLAHDFGEESLPRAYRPMKQFVNEQSLLYGDAVSVDAAFEAARATARELGVDLRLPNVHRAGPARIVSGKLRCDWPWRGPYITYDGQVMPCCMIGTPDRLSFASLRARGMTEVWTGAEYRMFREQLASDSPPDICRSCSVYNGTF